MLATVAAGLGFLFLLERVWPSELRGRHNDLIGWHVGVLGTTYAVIIGFMLFAVWTNFGTASSNSEAEANCLVNVAHSSRGLPAEERARILVLARKYTDVILKVEWPAMNHGRVSPASHLIVQQLWATLTTAETHSTGGQASLAQAFGELSRMTEYRRLRQQQVDASLPGILWMVLILGASLTIMSACLFGTANFRLHMIQVIMLALMLSSVLVAILDIDHPFEGAIHVDPIGFERAVDSLKDIR